MISSTDFPHGFPEELHLRYRRFATRRAEAEMLRRAGQTHAELMRDQLRRRYGWTLLEPRITVDADRRIITIRGNVVLRALGIRFTRGLQEIAGPEWTVVPAMNASDLTASWCSLREPVTRLRASCDSGELATEFLREDGPVQILARTASGNLIRGLDGTVGWTADRPASLEAPPHRRSIPYSWRTLVRSYLGIPYELGGTTRGGLDCSGLVQRLLREATGALVPRHSSDQFAVARLRGGPLREGQLLFLNRRGGTSLHVGVLVRSVRGTWTVLHASSARGKVVEDPLEEYLALGGTT